LISSWVDQIVGPAEVAPAATAAVSLVEARQAAQSSQQQVGVEVVAATLPKSA
jgi:hypothetical protein